MSREEKDQNVIVTPVVSDAVREAIEENVVEAGEWPEAKWWEVFDSIELAKLVEKALEANPSLGVAESRIEVLSGEAGIVRSKLLPLISFDYEQEWELLSKYGLYKALNPLISRNANLIDMGFNFSYEFDFWRKNRNRFESALGFVKAAEAEKAQVALLVTTALAQGYFALKTNLVRKELLEELMEVRRGVNGLQDLLAKNALLSNIPPALSAENVEEVQKMLDGIEMEITFNRTVIARLTGVGPEEVPEISSHLPPLPKKLEVPDNVSLDLVARRPDLMAAIWKMEATAAAVGAAKADYLPNIDLGGLLGLESIGFEKLFQGGTTGLFPAIHLPVFTGGKIKSNVKKKRAEFDEAVYSYNERLLESVSQVVDNLALTSAIFKEKASQDKVVKLANFRLTLTELRMQQGLDNRLQVLAQKEKVLEKKLDDVELVYGQYVAAIKLIKSLGGGYGK